MKRAGFAAVALCSLGCFPSVAQAAILDLNPTQAVFGPSYSQDGYTFTNSAGAASQELAAQTYINWIAYSSPDRNANGSNPTLVQNVGAYLGKIAFSTLTHNSAQPFSFTSIGLADGLNKGNGGQIEFTFNHISGPSTTMTVSLARGVSGLQTFYFDEHFLLNVIFTPLTTEGYWLQFDNVGLSASVAATPLPPAVALFASVLAGMSWIARRRRKPSGVLLPA